MQLDQTVFKRATLLLIAFIIPFNAVHELGHLIPCIASGGQGTFVIGIIASQASCTILHGSLAFAFAGGALATVVAFTPLLILKGANKIHKFPSIKIVFISLGLGHFLTALLETFAKDFYMSDIALPILGFTTFSIYIGVLVLFGRTETLRKDKWLTSKEANELFKRNLD